MLITIATEITGLGKWVEMSTLGNIEKFLINAHPREVKSIFKAADFPCQ